jgi:uncharacterized OsmC-like protein
MTATAAPAYLGNPANVDPEEAFVASLSSCHMLTFLAIACKQKFVLDSYEDEAVGHMEKNADGKILYREGFSGAVKRSRLKYKSHQVRCHQWGGKRPAGKWHPPNLRGRTCRSDASSLYLIL